MPETKNILEKKIDKQTILLIEDHPIILNIHKVFLEKMGLIVDTAMTGEEALRKFTYHHYSLVILDGGLPDMTGLDLGKKLREHEKISNRIYTPFILLSAFTRELIEIWQLELDIEGFELKPVNFEDLENLVLGCLKKYM